MLRSKLDIHAPRITAICLMILSAIAIGSTLSLLREVLVPFVLALFLAVAMEPMVDLLVLKLRLPRWIAVFATLLLGFSILAMFSVLVVTAVATFTEQSSDYTERIALLRTSYLEPALDFLSLPGDDGLSILFDEKTIGSYLRGATDAARQVASNGVLVLLFLVFLMLRPTVPRQQRNPTGQAIRDSVGEYVRLKTMLSAATGTLVGGVLWALGVDLALAFGLLAFFLNYVPSIGSVISTMLPLPLLLMNPEFTAVEVLVAVSVPGAIQIVVGNVIEPRVMSKSLDINTVAVVFALLFWGTLWGMVGVFLAVPLTAAVKIILESQDYTRPIARLLGT